MNRLVRNRDWITHYAALVVGVMLTTVGAYLSYLATSALSWREVTDGLKQVPASWMCIVPGVTCVLVGGLILIWVSRGKAG